MRKRHVSNHKLWRKPPQSDADAKSDRTEAPEVGEYTDRHVLRRVFQECAGYRWHVVGAFVLSLVATPLALLTPIPLALAVDSVIGDKPVPGLLDWMLPDSLTSSDLRVLLVTAALQIIIVMLTELQWLASYLLETYTGEKLTLRFRAR